MKNILKTLILALVMSVIFAATALAASTYSSCWKMGFDGIWRVYDSSGVLQKSCWFCDNGTSGSGPGTSNNNETWYLLDASGSMVSAPIVKDSSGRYYSLETEHNGYYGMLRHTTGNYNGVYIVFNQKHDGSFGCITNQDAIDTLVAQYGVTDITGINPANCVYSVNITGSTSPVGDNELTVKYYVDGDLYKTKTSTSWIKIADYEDRVRYWEDMNTGDWYYPDDYVRYRDLGRHTLRLEAVFY